MRMIRETYDVIKLQATRYVVGADGKRRRQQKTFWMTHNPFNRNEDGTVCTPDEIRKKLSVKARAWEAEGAQ
jgi:hypothetical protein